MTIALWVIAICTVIRVVQNTMQLKVIYDERGDRNNAYKEFVDSLHYTDKEFVERMLREFEEGENE